MDSSILARAVHVLALVHWIGGVAMVTLVLLPALMRITDAGARLTLFESLESRFGAQAKVSTLLAGGSGLWMLWETDGWWRLLDPAHWWVMLMVLVWAIFSIVLFIAEPLVLHDWFHRAAARDPEASFALVLRLHRVLLVLSALAVAGGVMGAHGGL